MKEMIELSEEERLRLTPLVRASFLDPIESIRKNCLKSLDQSLSGDLMSIFPGDNLIFLTMKTPNQETYTFPICDIPKMYAGRKPEFFRYHVEEGDKR